MQFVCTWRGNSCNHALRMGPPLRKWTIAWYHMSNIHLYQMRLNDWTCLRRFYTIAVGEVSVTSILNGICLLEQIPSNYMIAISNMIMIMIISMYSIIPSFTSLTALTWSHVRHRRVLSSTSSFATFLRILKTQKTLLNHIFLISFELCLLVVMSHQNLSVEMCSHYICRCSTFFSWSSHINYIYHWIELVYTRLFLCGKIINCDML